jgi:hypothetical protein
VFEALSETLPRVADGWVPFFCPMWLNNGHYTDYLSEDWSIQHRAREAGCKVFASMWPLTKHSGHELFTACPDEMVEPL